MRQAILVGVTAGLVRATVAAAAEPPPADFPVATPDWATVTRVDLDAGPPNWTLRPSVPAQPVAGLSGRAVMLTATTGRAAEAVRGPFFSARATPVAAVAFDPLDGNYAHCRLERVDLSTGTDLGTTPLPDGETPVALGPGGTTLLCQPIHNGRQGRRLDLIALDRAGPRHVVSWYPFAGPTDPAGAAGPHVLRAAFVDAAHVLTVSDDGRAAVWAVSADGRPPRAVYVVAGPGMFNAALGEDNQLLAVPSGRGVHLLDALTGRAVGLIGYDHPENLRVGIAAGGGRICLLEPGVARVYDGATGALRQAVAVPDRLVGGPPPTWLADGHLLLVGGQRVVDPDRHLQVWDYDRVDSAGNGLRVQRFGSRLYYMPADDFGRHPAAMWLASVLAPDAKVDAALAAAVADPDRFVVHPGLSVTIDVSGVSTGDADRQHIRDVLARRLTAAGFVVAADAAPVTVVATRAPAADESVTFQFPDGRPPEAATLARFAQRLAFVAAASPAAPVWVRSQGGRPAGQAVVPIGVTQTVADRIAAAGRWEAAYFDRVDLPDYVPKGGEFAVLGSSRLAAPATPAAARPTPSPRRTRR